MFQTELIGEIKTNILCSINSLFFNFWILHLWQQMEEYCRAIQSADDIIWRMRFACCLTKATNTHSEYLILIALLLQQWLHERVSVVSYNYIVVCFLLGNSPASEFCTPTFRNPLFLLHRQVGVHLPAYENGTDRVFRKVGV
jgi:hypothetical protein